MRGKVVPSTLRDIRLKAEMTDGSIINGESEIPKAHKRIRTMAMEPADAPATASAVQAILNADILILVRVVLYQCHT